MKSSSLYAFALLVCGGLLVACSDKKTDDQPLTEEPATAVSEESSQASFDISALPISTVELGETPYFDLPEGYEHRWKNEITELDQLAFWTKDHFEIPEGKIFANRITPAKDKSFSPLELMKGMEQSILDAGGVKIHEGKIPLTTVNELKEKMGDNHTLKYLNAYGFMGYGKSWVYVIRQADKNIWVQFNESDDNASMLWGVLTQASTGNQ